jgi:VWFA-related protein
VTGTRKIFRIFALLFVCVSAPAFTQQDQPLIFTPLDIEHDPGPDPTQGVIRLDVSVTDRSGNSAAGLGQHDFTLRDNGQPTKIVSVHAFDGVTAKPDSPTQVIVVIDGLNSPRVAEDGSRRLTPEQEAETFLRRHQGHLSQPVSIYRLTRDGVKASTIAYFDGNALAEEIASRREAHVIWKTPTISENLAQAAAGGNTGWNLTHSLTALGSIALQQRLRPGRKLMFWLGPGWQINRLKGTGLFDFYSELSTRLREARIELWCVTESATEDGYDNPVPGNELNSTEFLKGKNQETDEFRDLALQAVARHTGGGILATSGDMAGVIDKHVEKASTFYVLTFDPSRTNALDEYHDLEVEVRNPDLTAHTRTGYFDQPVFYDQTPAGTERVSVEQLEHILSTRDHVSDDDLTRRLSAMELTERLNSVKLAAWKGRLKGKKARESFVALADKSVFQPLPSAEIPSTVVPDLATQRQMLGQTVGYVNRTISKLPNFFARRTMVEYHELPMEPGQTWKTTTGDQSLHLDQTFTATLLFRDGKEVVVEQATKGKPLMKGEPMLSTVGTFGSLLQTVVAGATTASSNISWGRWEQGANGLQAVFHYEVPQESPFFYTGFGYLTDDDRVVQAQKRARFHGEFGIDPGSGAILRLTVEADLEPRLPLERSEVMVEYSPVVIGGNTCICPTRSVTISRERSVTDIHEWGAKFTVYAPFKTILTDMTYDDYHEFRPTSRLLPGFTPVQENR